MALLSMSSRTRLLLVTLFLSLAAVMPAALLSHFMVFALAVVIGFYVIGLLVACFFAGGGGQWPSFRIFRRWEHVY